MLKCGNDLDLEEHGICVALISQFLLVVPLKEKVRVAVSELPVPMFT